MRRLILLPVSVVTLSLAAAACGTSQSSSLETLPPIRTTTSTTTSTTEPDLRERVYIVQPGDNVSEIARAYQVTAPAIIELNDLPSNGTIQPGQELRIPNLVVDVTLPPVPESTDAP